MIERVANSNEVWGPLNELYRKDMELWGTVPSLLSESDSRSTKQQIGLKRHLDVKLDPSTMTLNPDVAPMRPLSLLIFRDERLFLYDNSWVVIMKPNTSWKAGWLGHG